MFSFIPDKMHRTWGHSFGLGFTSKTNVDILREQHNNCCVSENGKVYILNYVYKMIGR